MDYLDVNDLLKQTAERMSFKETTQEDDIVLLIRESTMMWAVVCKIEEEADSSGKRLVIIKILSIPPLEMHLKLTEDQLDGKAPFDVDRAKTVYMKALDLSVLTDDDIKEVYKKENLDETDFSDKIILDEKDIIN